MVIISQTKYSGRIGGWELHASTWQLGEIQGDPESIRLRERFGTRQPRTNPA
jgi:hypothetical protein